MVSIPTLLTANSERTMKKIVLVLFSSMLVLLVMYRFSNREMETGQFQRFMKDVKGKGMIAVLAVQEVNGLFYCDSNLLWLHTPNRIYSLNDKNVVKDSFLLRTSESSPLVNLYVDRDSLFYYLGNTNAIIVRSIRNKFGDEKRIPLPVAITDFIKVDSGFILFHLQGNDGSVRAKHLNGGLSELTNFRIDSMEGGANTYSGKLIQAGNQSFFIPFYRDSVWVIDCKSLTVDYLVTRDRVAQDLKVNRTGNRYSLDPRVKIHRIGAGVSKQYIFLSSYVKSSLTQMENRSKGCIVDVYDRKTKAYQFSFKIPEYKGKVLSDFAVSREDRLAALYQNDLVIYDLNSWLNDY